MFDAGEEKHSALLTLTTPTMSSSEAAIQLISIAYMKNLSSAAHTNIHNTTAALMYQLHYSLTEAAKQPSVISTPQHHSSIDVSTALLTH